MKTGRAIAAGIAGAVVMSVLMAVARRLGFDVNLEALLGSAFGVAEPYKWLGGFAIHLSIGGIVALLYATAFEYAIQRSSWWVGGIFGLAHGMMAGLFMTAIPAMDPAIPGTMSAPGPFLSYVRFGPEIFLGLHVVYGAVVGLVYRPVNRAHEARAQGTRSLTHAK